VTSPGLIKLDSSNFEKHTESAALVLFWADWCPLCIILLNLFEELALSFPGLIASVNFDENPEVAKRFEVYGVPTVIAYRIGEVIDVRPGFREKEQYLEMIECICKYES
jgi:thioredoxin 1